MEDRNIIVKNAVEKVSASITGNVITAKNAEEVKYVSMVSFAEYAKNVMGHQSANMVVNVIPVKNAEGQPSASITSADHNAKTAMVLPSVSIINDSLSAKTAAVLKSANMTGLDLPVKNVMDHQSANMVKFSLPVSSVEVVVRVKDMLSQTVDISSATLANYDWVHDKPFYVSFDGGCCNTKRRIDLWCIIGNVLFAIEIDENQHKDRAENYEETRYNDLAMDFTGRQIFVRINPDAFVRDGIKLDPSFEERLNIVEQKIAELLKLIDVEVDEDSFTFVKVHHLFYDE